jgi:hypothetical protein
MNEYCVKKFDRNIDYSLYSHWEQFDNFLILNKMTFDKFINIILPTDDEQYDLILAIEYFHLVHQGLIHNVWSFYRCFYICQQKCLNMTLKQCYDRFSEYYKSNFPYYEYPELNKFVEHYKYIHNVANKIKNVFTNPYSIINLDSCSKEGYDILTQITTDIKTIICDIKTKNIIEFVVTDDVQAEYISEYIPTVIHELLLDVKDNLIDDASYDKIDKIINIMLYNMSRIGKFDESRISKMLIERKYEEYKDLFNDYQLVN